MQDENEKCPKKIIKVAGYVRVSSKKQVNKGISLEAQEHMILHYCKYKGWTVHKIYHDRGISGSTIYKRKGFKDLMSDANARLFDVVLVPRMDRFSRTLIDLILSLDKLRKLGVDFISIHESIDTTTATGRANFHMIGTFAQLQREMTAEYVDDVLTDKFERGKFIGKLPFGYKWKNKKVEVDLDKAMIVKQVFKLTNFGVKYKEICSRCNISTASYYNILKNKAYIGMVNYKGEIKKGVHTLLVSKEVFEKANSLIKSH